MQRSLRRATLGVALTAMAAGALPALAQAESTCTYDPATRTATVFDDSGPNPMTLERSGQAILAKDFNSGDFGRLCVSASDLATVTTTDRITIVRHQPAAGNDFVEIDEFNGELAPGATPETDGHSEIEVTVLDDPGFTSDLHLFGTTGNDVFRAGGHGRIDVGRDDDSDITDLTARHLLLGGGAGQDFLSGRGVGALVGSAVPVDVSGGTEADTVLGSAVGNDRVDGNSGDDTLFTLNQHADAANGGAGFDTATTDASDLVQFNDIESRTSVSVGKARLAPRKVHAHAGGRARVDLTWTHPKSWRSLKMVNLQLFDGAVPLGNVYVRMRDGWVSGHGALAHESTRVTHHGRSARAGITVHVPRSLRGRTLRLAVQAADRHGHLQQIPEAGELKVVR